MNQADLMGYLKRVVKLEGSVYAQQQTIRALDMEMEKLGYPQRIPEVEKPVLGESSLSGCASVVIVVLAIGAGAIIEAILSGILDFEPTGVLAIVVGVLAFGVLSVMASKDVTENNKHAMAEYQERLESRSALVEQDRRRVENELKQKERLQQMRRMAALSKDQTQAALKALYDTNIIFPKYRNAVAVCSFYEYFASGRCTELTGHEGAYNIYETELQLNRIIGQLDQVIENLQQIRQNQWTLYESIERGNRLSQQILSETMKQSRMLKSAAQSAELSAYYSRIAADNAEACAWIGVADYLKNG